MSHLVLIVDDDPHIRQLLAFAFARINLRVAEATAGETALSTIAEVRPDLVVLDINMRRMDKLEVCRRTSPAEQVIMSAFGISREVRNVRISGGCGF